ncbi:MAG: hypothetical protein AAF555_02830 [Verrucomicrobiota bacterium]
MRLAWLSLLGTLWLGCTSPPANHLQVKPVHLSDLEIDYRRENQMLHFEKERLLYGALSGSERRARQGHYFWVDWKVADPSLPVSLLLEYRQESTTSQLHRQVLEIPAGEIKSRNRAEFAVNGPEYAERGRITSWRLSLRQEGVELAEEESFVWHD